MSEITVLYNICTDIWVEMSESIPVSTNLIRLQSFRPIEPGGPRVLEKQILENILEHKLPSTGKYHYLNRPKYIAYKKVNTLLPWNTKKEGVIFECRSMYMAEKFRTLLSKKLINVSFSPLVDLEDTLKAIADYTFSQHFSYWIYNPHTDHVILHSSSFQYKQTVITASNSHSTIATMLKSNCDTVVEEIEEENIESCVLPGMKTVTRFKITSSGTPEGFEVQGILSFYSQQEGFAIRDETISWISEMVGLKMSRNLTLYVTRYNTMLIELSEKYKPGQLSEFLEIFADRLKEILGYEAVSIFMASHNDRTHLELRALSEYQNTTIPSKVPIYNTRDNSISADIYNKNKMIVSYKIATEPRNSHTFNECTEHESENWIGIPISDSTSTVHGIVRAKNRIRKGKIVPINKIDIDVFRGITSVLAYLCSRENSYLQHKAISESKLKEQLKENEQLNDYLKTFRHEIKSPLIVVTQASNLLKSELIREGLVKEEVIPKRIRDILYDLDMVGDRLVFVTNVLTFDANDLVKDIKSTLIFKDVVAPILAFSTRYAKNRKKIIKVEKDTLFLPKVHCDSNATAMVFHIILDNAIKYAKKSSDIHIYGQSGKGTASIFIESYGLPILEEEKEDVFRKFFRGHHVKLQKIEGSGIGLFLAAQIMQLNNSGVLLLKKLVNPTTFEIRLNQEKELSNAHIIHR